MAMFHRLNYEYDMMQTALASLREPLSTRGVSRSSTRPLPTPTVPREVLRFRWNLLGKVITINEAAKLLTIKPNSQAQDTFQTVIGLSQDIRHIYDPIFEKEYIVFLHPRREYVAVYQTTPLYQDISLGYSVMRSDQFFIDNNVDHLLLESYLRLRAARIIKRHRSFRNWLEKPITKDSRRGIWCDLAFRASQEHEANSTPHVYKLRDRPNTKTTDCRIPKTEKQKNDVVSACD